MNFTMNITSAFSKKASMDLIYLSNPCMCLCMYEKIENYLYSIINRNFRLKNGVFFIQRFVLFGTSGDVTLETALS